MIDAKAYLIGCLDSIRDGIHQDSSKMPDAWDFIYHDEHFNALGPVSPLIRAYISEWHDSSSGYDRDALGLENAIDAVKCLMKLNSDQEVAELYMRALATSERYYETIRKLRRRIEKLEAEASSKS